MNFMNIAESNNLSCSSLWLIRKAKPAPQQNKNLAKHTAVDLLQ
jgi:hypothetical protein